MSKIYNCHAVQCVCPWCTDTNPVTFGENDVLLLDTKELNKALKSKKVTDAQIERWLKL